MTNTNDQQPEMSAAMASKKAAVDEVARISTSKRNVLARLDDLKKQDENALEAALAAEKQAAAEIALAVANGAQGVDMKKAEGRLAEATRALASIRQRIEEGSGLRTALEAQATTLNTQLGTANEQLTKAQSEVDGERRQVLSAKWDSAVDALMAVGVDLIDLLPERGVYIMRDMKIPVFGRGVNVIREDLVKMRNTSRSDAA